MLRLIALSVLCWLAAAEPQSLHGVDVRGLRKPRLLDHFIFENCGDKNDVIQMNNLNVSPVPLPFPGKVHINGAFNFTQDVPPNTHVALKMYRETHIIFPIDIKIPCIAGVGSCDHDICELIHTSNGLFCKFFPPEAECNCPIKKGIYQVSNFEFETPKLTGIAHLFAKANFKVEIRITSSNHQLACYKIQFSMNAD